MMTLRACQRTIVTLLFSISATIVLTPDMATAKQAAHSSHTATSVGGGPFGLGLALGDPTALTAKYWLDGGKDAVDLGLAYWLGRYFLVYSDYDYHFPGAFGARNEFVSSLSPYIGIGGILIFASTSERNNRGDKYFADNTSAALALGLRIPIGVEWRPRPIGVFLEFAPGLTVIPGTFGFLQAAIGVRYYF
jgi:hypothetical protein